MVDGVGRGKTKRNLFRAASAARATHNPGNRDTNIPSAQMVDRRLVVRSDLMDIIATALRRFQPRNKVLIKGARLLVHL